MRRIHKIFLTGCGYAILILSMFYAFAAISDFISTSIPPKQYLLILSFGFVISIAEFIYEELKIRKIYKGLIHYLLLLLAFCLIFILGGNISSQKNAAVFIAITLYTIFYFVMWAIVHFTRKAINKADDALDKKTGSSKNAKAAKKGTYKSLYSDDR